MGFFFFFLGSVYIEIFSIFVVVLDWPESERKESVE